MTVIKDVFVVMDKIGLLEVILPFVLVFTIVYEVLNQTKVLGPDGNRYNAMVAFVLGFFVVAALQLVRVLTVIVQWVALATVGVTMVVIVTRALGGTVEFEKAHYPKAIALLVIALIGVYALGLNGVISIDFVESIIVPIFLCVAVIGSILYYVFGRQAASRGGASSTSGAGSAASSSGASSAAASSGGLSARRVGP